MVSELSGWEPLTTAMLILVVAGLYTTAGGFPSVIATQALQGVAVILSVLALLGLGLAGQPLGVDLSVLRPSGESPLSVAFFYMSLTVVALWYFWSDQFMVQRVLSARSHRETRRGVLLAVAFISVMALLGLSITDAGTILDGPSPVHALPAMMGSMLVLSLTLATVAGMLQSAASMITLDLVRPFRRSATDLSLVLVGRLSTTGAAVIVLLLISAIGPITPVGLSKFLDAHLAVAPPAAALFVGVLFVRRMTVQGAVAAMITGAVMGLAFMWLPREWNLPAVSFAVVSFALSLGVLLIFSYVGIGPLRDGQRVAVEADLEQGVEAGVGTGHAGTVVSR